MKQNFEELASGTTFYDPQSHAFFVKRDDFSATMLHNGEDLGFEGDAFDAKDLVITVDATALPNLPASSTIKTSTGPLHFNGTVTSALDLLDALKSSKKTSSKSGQQMLAQLEKQLRVAVVDFGVTGASVAVDGSPTTTD